MPAMSFIVELDLQKPESFLFGALQSNFAVVRVEHIEHSAISTRSQCPENGGLGSLQPLPFLVRILTNSGFIIALMLPFGTALIEIGEESIQLSCCSLHLPGNEFVSHIFRLKSHQVERPRDRLHADAFDRPPIVEMKASDRS